MHDKVEFTSSRGAVRGFAQLAGICLLVLPASVLAADLNEAGAPALEQEAYPAITGSLELELAKDRIYKSDDPLNEIIDVGGSAALAVRMGLVPGLAINLGATLESVLDGEPGEDRYFDGLGLYVDTLNAEFSSGPFTLVAGKFGPGFGTAWDVTPGMYGTTFAEDYELGEMIGVGIAAELGATAFGTITAGANAFFVDKTVLSESAFHNRGRTSLSDGGAGNTGHLDNFSLTLDGADVPGIDGFSWHLGYRHLSAGRGDDSDESGVVAGFSQEHSVTESLDIVVTGEAAHFSGFGGADDKATYFTGGIGLVSGPWHAEFAANFRNIDYDGGGNDRDTLYQVSAGYEFENGVDVSVGWAQTEEGGIQSDVVGIRLTKTIEF
ncbi:MAG: hypothetical protein M9908_06105 [Phyllobacteriaceae bacterium]|nr:hypothetical protein [Phyllobacteriaceae bacterium]